MLARRPDEHDPYQFDDPMFGSYRWVSMLNPFELADGAPFENGQVDGLWSADLAPIVVHGGVSDGEWNGRRVWTAVVEATENYASRCSCCPVLVGDHSMRRLAQENNGMTVPQRQWPQAQRVRLDVQTGILVQLEEIGGHRPGTAGRRRSRRWIWTCRRHFSMGEVQSAGPGRRVTTGGCRPGGRVGVSLRPG